MMDRAKQNQQLILDELSSLSNWEDRYKKIIQLGKALPPYPEEFRKDQFLVKGCQSQVWLHVHLNPTGQMLIQVDSDALIVKGLSALIKKAYSGLTPKEVLQTSPDFIATLGLKEHLSPSRANGFLSMVQQIQLYAKAFSLLEKK